MSKRNKIKKKIHALLEKTVENGATKAEMESAISKANELMMEFYITLSEVKDDPYINEKCISVTIPLRNTGYDLKAFYYDLGKLFDCIHYFNSKRKTITFFGYEEDVELCCYFYELITKSCMKERELFIKSEKYKELKKWVHWRSVVSSFIKGYIYEVAMKLQKKYKERESKFANTEFGLILYDKNKKVNEQFEKLNITLNGVTSNQERKSLAAYNEGAEKGESLELVQGIREHKKEILKIS